MAIAFAHALAPRSSARRLPSLGFRPARSGTTATASFASAEQATVRLPHIPVLLAELSSFFPDGIDTFLDCTIGAGGHASHLLRHKRITQYVALDKDPNALSIARSALRPFDNVRYARADFRDMRAVLDELKVPEVNAVLMDIGTSSMQLDQAERGFSFTHDGPIDMRMSCTGMSARDILDTASERELAELFWTLGEERQSRKIARVLVNERERRPIESTKQLATLVERVKGWRKKGIHPATQVFQALRIATNDELAALEEGLLEAIEMAAPHATIAVISFHSLEDRIAKRVFRMAAERVGGVKLLTKKPVVAAEEECEKNPRARSAKLRVVEKLEPGQVPISGKINKYRER
ncbi:Ribosomal RNA small subunit methyltransferase H [Gracilariopsis chorda]|uniref:Ribosomal RNA small subunit methyltransferase H n=1 Tax=Gracilariopsis chorda TaxID=448386 RepID=A0A2V3IEC5_9FLOR|nr:Ribosomal RNA small subunit methyltransferase H [Gracilariopsis chorda]|eukprot:PXF40402.1 Ribosomal RNA small subunit methyltransferase H [Gracilariopsis chorda]